MKFTHESQIDYEENLYIFDISYLSLLLNKGGIWYFINLQFKMAPAIPLYFTFPTMHVIFQLRQIISVIVFSINSYHRIVHHIKLIYLATLRVCTSILSTYNKFLG